ncbi:MAG: hypothetical protein JSS65_09115 [Armatimonadetes bacterium]|nr:hypothetical protein [Armatimonadota bacterium]
MVPAFLVVATASWADDLPSARQMVAESFGRLALMNNITVNLSGNVVLDSGIDPFAVQMVVERRLVAGEEKIYFEGLVTEAAMTTKRYVGDGDHLWIYDTRRHAYSVVDYGSRQTAGQRGSRLFSTLKRVTQGPAQFVASFLADIDRCRTNGSGTVATTWTPWLSTATVKTSRMSIACNARPPADASLTYSFRVDDEDRLWLTGAAYDASKFEAHMQRHTAWSLVYSSTPPASTDYTFDPGTATPVSITLAQGGG